MLSPNHKARGSGLYGCITLVITIDTEARDDLPHLYGAVNWTLVEDVQKLPLRVFDMHRRLPA